MRERRVGENIDCVEVVWMMKWGKVRVVGFVVEEVNGGYEMGWEVVDGEIEMGVKELVWM